MSPARRMAFAVILGEIEGGKFNWKSLRWEKPDRD